MYTGRVDVYTTDVQLRISRKLFNGWKEDGDSRVRITSNADEDLLITFPMRRSLHTADPRTLRSPMMSTPPPWTLFLSECCEVACLLLTLQA